MQKKISDIESSFNEKLDTVSSTEEVNGMRIEFLGKKGHLNALMVHLKEAAPEEKRVLGKEINLLKAKISKSIEHKNAQLHRKEMQLKLKTEKVDISMPGRQPFSGRKHPIQQTLDEVLDILRQMGFSVFSSPEIDSDYYNYGGLNYPDDHPARDMQDTFYINDELLLRSHTTSFQQRVFEHYNLPVRCVCPGKCYRNETISSRHHVLFHQIDGLYVDEGVSFADLMTMMKDFYTALFGKNTDVRYRPSFFPFVEPGMEVDISCLMCQGKGCPVCKKTGWLEVAGAGMVHPEVLKQGGHDPEKVSGYAWGMGIERLCMLKHRIKDIRYFLENDFRFLQQF